MCVVVVLVDMWLYLPTGSSFCSLKLCSTSVEKNLIGEKLYEITERVLGSQAGWRVNALL